MLGGGYTSRLNQEIRLKRGLSYGAGSTLAALRSRRTASPRCQTKNASAAEVVDPHARPNSQRLGSEPVPADFLATRQAVLTGDFARDLETNARLRRAHSPISRATDCRSISSSEYLDASAASPPTTVRTFAAQHSRPGRDERHRRRAAEEIAKPLRALFPKLEVIPLAELDLDSPTLRRAPANADRTSRLRKPRIAALFPARATTAGQQPRMGGRVVDCARLESVFTAR